MPANNFSATTVVGTTAKPAINLLRGWPHDSLIPVDLIKAAATAVLSDSARAYPGLEYGPDAGDETFREAIAEWLSSFYQPSKAISPARICINGGASQSLGSILSVYTDPEYTRNIWLVAPTYMLVFRIFEDAGFAGKMRGVLEDEHGIDIEYLRREIQKSEDEAKSRGNTAPRYKRERAKVYKHVIYCVPTFSNPSSRTMTQERRVELVRLAREFDALVVCDDVYDFLQFPADSTDKSLEQMKSSHVPRLVDIDHSLAGTTDFGNVVSNGTFTKIAGPGLRCGWIEGTEKFAYGVSQAGIQRSGGAPCQLTSTYVTHMLEMGQIQNHINTVLRPAYATRYRIMAEAIKEHLVPLGFKLPQPDRDVVGGYFIWLGLPSGLSATSLAEICQREEFLIIAPGDIFEVPGEGNFKFGGEIRLCFAWEDEPRLGEAVGRIKAAAKRLLEEPEREYVVIEKKGGGQRGKLQGFM